MSSNGLCRHNNLGSYCPSCLKGNTMKQMGAYTIPNTNITIPDSSEIFAAATKGAGGLIAKDVATSQGIKDAAISAAGESLGTKIVKFYNDNPAMFYGGAALLAILLYAGVKSFSKKSA